MKNKQIATIIGLYTVSILLGSASLIINICNTSNQNTSPSETDFIVETETIESTSQEETESGQQDEENIKIEDMGSTAKATDHKKGQVYFAPLPVNMSTEDQEHIFNICRKYNVAYPLVMAIIEHESQFNVSARSETGDSGLMQINDCNKDSFSQMGYSNLYDLDDNVSAGCYMLSYLFGKYDGETDFVLMAYNAGEQGAQKMKDKGIYQTDYAREIEARAQYFTDISDDELLNQGLNL